MSFYILHGIKIQPTLHSEIVGIYDCEFMASFMFKQLIASEEFNINFITLHVTHCQTIEEAEEVNENINYIDEAKWK